MADVKVLIHLALLTIIHTGSGADIGQVKDLKSKLFTNYDRHIRPVLNQSDSVLMNISFHLTTIDSLDLKSQKLSWSGWMQLIWHDESLVWNASEHGGTEFITLPQTDVWLPDIVITNDVKSRSTMGNSNTLVYVSSDGKVTWEPGIVTETSCKVDIRNYPFDKQTCEFTFMSWMTPKGRLHPTSISDTVELSGFISHGEFSITASSTRIEYFPMPYMNDELVINHYVLSLARRPTFYWLIMILPMMTFPLLCPISFLVPVESGEKITLSITVVLSFLVFIGSMSESMPKLSDTLSSLVVYSSVQTTIAILTVIANGVIIAVHKLPPDFKFCNYTTDKRMDQYGMDKLNSVFKLSGFPFLIGDRKHGEKHTNLVNEKKISPEELEKWIRMSRKMDKICFFLFLGGTILVSVVFAIVIANRAD